MSGKPKGVVHTSAGYMVWASTTFKYVFDYKEKDVFWCTADCGWITGHSYLTYGPMINGATQVEEIRLEEIRLEEIREKTERGRRADFGGPTKQNWNRNIRSSYAGGGVKGVRV